MQALTPALENLSIEIDAALAGLSAVIVLLLVGAVFGRLHGGKAEGKLDPVGDRVACGMLAVPLIALLVRLAFPGQPLAWALIAPLPVLLYSALLAAVDAGYRLAKEKFTITLFGGLLLMYLVAAAYFLGAHA